MASDTSSPNLSKKMSIIDYFSEDLLADAVHENFHSLLHLMCQKTPGFEWVKLAGVTLMVCKTPTSIYNRVVQTQIKPEEVGSKIKEIKDYYDSNGSQFLWMVGPRDTPADLSHRLEDYGFVRSGSPGMAIDLRQLRVPVSPSGFRVERVQDKESLKTYSVLMPQAFGFDDLSKIAVSGWINGVGICDGLHHYIGYLDDNPVATSSVFYSDGVAGLYCVASMPVARGRGIGSVMSAVPLLEAVEDGYNVGVLHSTMMAHGVYHRLGFKDISEIINYSHAESGDSYLQTLSRRE
jgi:GNAT superfamily N-acetyltransferase